VFSINRPNNLVRILFVFDMLELGGAERQAMLLARYLRKEYGATVEVVGFSHPGALTQICEREGFPWHLVPSSSECSTRRLPGSIARFIRHIRRLRPDVLMPYTIHPNVLCGAFWRYTGASACIWNQRDAHQRSSRRWLERLAIKRTPRFIANSRASARFLTEVLGADSEKVSVVPNGVVLAEPQMTRNEWRSRLGVPENAVVCCMVANLTRNKDHRTLLAAWRLIASDPELFRQNPTLVLAGRQDETAEELKRMASDLGIADSVHFIGAVEDVAGLLSACDVGVHSSLSEGCPNSILEMMVQGLPVVGTDIEGIRDVLPPESHCLLSAPGNHEVLAARLKELILSGDLRKQYGAANSDYARAHFTPDVMCERMASIIREVILSRRPQNNRNDQSPDELMGTGRRNRT
jgi:glycosyltransferase involved in cell wall biosynthesis